MSKKADHKSIVGEIVGLIESQPPGGHQPWFRKHYPTHGGVLEEIHSAWHAGKFGVQITPTSRVISEKLASLGVKVGTDGVRRWLNKKPNQW